MMMNQTKVLLFILVVSIQMSCISAKKQTNMISQHTTALSSALKGDMKSEQKIDILGETLVDMMSQSLDFKNPVKGGKFVQKFADNNGPIIEQLIGSLEKDAKNLDPMSQIAMGMNLMSKPYFGKLLELMPQFEKKFKSIAFVANLASKVGKPLKMFGKAQQGGGLNLGNLLGQEEE